jgi:hypothetical protein
VREHPDVGTAQPEIQRVLQRVLIQFHHQLGTRALVKQGGFPFLFDGVSQPDVVLGQDILRLFQFGTLIPYALTGGCLTHLTERSKAFVKSVAEGKRMIGSKHSTLNYTATAAHHEQFELDGQKFRNVTVVTMTLEWSQRSMWFSKKRVVVFDEKRNPVKVFHDGTTSVGVI